jgi:hypothetical protein
LLSLGSLVFGSSSFVFNNILASVASQKNKSVIILGILASFFKKKSSYAFRPRSRQRNGRGKTKHVLRRESGRVANDAQGQP